MTFYKNLSKIVLVVSVFVLFGNILPSAVSAAGAPTCTFTANPANVSHGGMTELKWDTTGASSVYINNGVGYVNQDGSIKLSGFTTNVVYTLTAINAEGSTECTARVDVKDSNNNNYLAPTCNITASPESVSYNGSVILSWSSYGATTARINNGVGYVKKDGSKVVEHITDTTTYSLVVSNSHGSNTCKVTVYRNTAPAGPAPTCTLEINSNVLSWNAYHSNYAQIDNGIGAVASSGSRVVAPANSTTYTMAVRDQYGRVGYCSKAVTVNGNYYGNITGNGSYYNYNAGNQNNHQQSYSYYHPSTYRYANTVSLRHIPYTGANDALYVLAMILLAVASTTTLYKFGKEALA